MGQRAGWLAVAAFLGGAATAQATTFAVRPIPNLIYEAPTILRGQVVSTRTDWGVGGDGGKRIYAYTEIEVKEAFKSPSGQTYQVGQIVRVRELGGEKDGITMQVPGAAQFQQGEDTVLFLGTTALDGSIEIRGLGTGKYEVTQDEKGNEYLSGGMLSLAQSDTTSENSTLEWPLQKLRDTVATQRNKPPAPVPAGPLRTVTVEPTPQATAQPLAQPLQSPSPVAKDGPREERNAHGRAWKWVLGVLLGGLGYAWIRRRA